jgi:micrococcal nuclease
LVISDMARRRRNIKLSSPIRQRKLVAALAYLIVVAVIAIAAVQRAGPRPAGSDWSIFDQKSLLVSGVVDGDTLTVQDSTGHQTTVRLLGIDAPEMVDPSTNQPAHWAERAKAYVQARAAGKAVTLRLEPVQTRDRYDRLLAYIYLSDTDCLNMDLVRDGQAYADRRFRHSYRPQYEMAENEARRKLRGLWKDVTEDTMPAWRRAWLHSRDQ